jgi:hypothetical protein
MSSTEATRYELTETWQMNNRLNLRLLDGLSDEQLAATILPRGRAVTSYFVHIHMARFYWLERRAKGLANKLKKIPGGMAPRATLRQALIDSGRAMEKFFADVEGTENSKAPGWALSVFWGMRSRTRRIIEDRSCCISKSPGSPSAAIPATASGIGTQADCSRSRRVADRQPATPTRTPQELFLRSIALPHP